MTIVSACNTAEDKDAELQRSSWPCERVSFANLDHTVADYDNPEQSWFYRTKCYVISINKSIYVESKSVQSASILQFQVDVKSE